jgi:serine/threonine-protein kinase
MDGSKEPDDTQRLRELFDLLLPLDPAARHEALAAHCGDDPRLREELEALLAAAERTDEVLREAVGAAAAGIVTGAPDGCAPGTRIGPYRVLRELGRGGMGVVHLAERADGRYRQQVALKLLSGTRTDTDAAERFRRERQILARLRHPGIARLLDGGEADDGTPYLVMEYVPGEPVDRWCDRHHAPLRRRLELLRAVCDAVDHAHRNLIIHRDLKASNLLVEADGTPRLVDFGIAKLLATVEDEALARTRTDARVMTPRAASPEQLRGETPTTATDVHALGLLLYELLTGVLPFDPSGGSLPDFYHAVLEADPIRPSQALARLAPERAGPVARDRSTTPARLRRALAGDLDRIVLKALRKEPERRYGSARELAEDLRRYLNDEPIEARGDSLRYRTGKFLRRNRVPASLGALAIVAALGFGLWHTQRLTAERDVARQERATAEQVTRFLVDIFASADPEVTRGDRITARELLETGTRRFREGLDADPAVRLRLVDALARAHLSLGLYDRAAALVDDALADPELASLDPRATLRLRAQRANAIGYGGDLEAGVSAYRAVLDDARAAKLAADPYFVERRIDLAHLLLASGQLAAAREAADRAMVAAEALPTAEEPERTGLLGDATGVRGSVRTALGDLDGARADLERAYALIREAHGEDHPLVPTFLHELGAIDFRGGDFRAAADKLRVVIERQREILGEQHADVGRSYASLAAVRWAMNDLPAAEAAARESNRIKRLTLPPDHDDIVHTDYTLAGIVLERGRFAEAEALLERTLARQRANNAPEDPQIGRTLAALGRARAARLDLEGAEAAYRDALSQQERALGPDHLWIAETYRDLGLLELLRDRPEAALAATGEALARALRAADPEHPEVAAIRRDHGRALLAAGRPEEARTEARSALERFEQASDPDGIGTSRLLLARIALATDALEEAERESAAGLRVLEAHHGEEAVRVSEALALRARVLDRRGQPRRAQALAKRARRLRESHYPPSHPVDRRLAALLSATAS